MNPEELAKVQCRNRSGRTMIHPVARNYPEQFATTSDLLHVVIPRHEIISEMSLRGEDETLNDVCLAVAVVADALGIAMAAPSAELD